MYYHPIAQPGITAASPKDSANLNITGLFAMGSMQLRAEAVLQLKNCAPGVSDEMRIITPPMEVTKIRAYSSFYAEYSLCPRCGKPMGREYQNYCSNCGQKLAWNSFRNGAVEMEYQADK